MARTTSWKGYLKLSLVSCAVALAPAQTDQEKVRFNTLNKKTGNRLKQQLLDAETGEVVEREDVARGYEVGKDQYIFVEDEDFDTIALESKHTIDITEFVPVDELDPLWMGDNHYLMPDDEVAQEAFAVIRDAMAKTNMAGIARVIISKRERWVAVRPRGKGIVLTTMRYPYEVRSEDQAFERVDDVDLPPQAIEAGEEIIDEMAGHFVPDKLVDRYQSALRKMIKEKQAGRVHEAPAARPAAAEGSTKVVSLMDSLRRAIEAEKDARRPKAESKARGGKAKRGAA